MKLLSERNESRLLIGLRLFLDNEVTFLEDTKQVATNGDNDIIYTFVANDQTRDNVSTQLVVTVNPANDNTIVQLLINGFIRDIGSFENVIERFGYHV